MKSHEELKAARRIINERIATPGLSDVQKALLCGVSCALVWSSGDPNSTMDRLLDGEPLHPGKDHAPALKKLDAGIELIKSHSTGANDG